MTTSRATGSEVKLPRGTIKSFREYLNEKFRGTGVNHYSHGGGRHIYQQRTREYGDYLYHQDREKFNVELADALAGDDYKDWKRP